MECEGCRKRNATNAVVFRSIQWEDGRHVYVDFLCDPCTTERKETREIMPGLSIRQFPTSR